MFGFDWFKGFLGARQSETSVAVSEPEVVHYPAVEFVQPSHNAPVVSLFHIRTHRAKKAYVCSICSVGIDAGNQYARGTSRGENGLISHTVCIPCSERHNPELAD